MESGIPETGCRFFLVFGVAMPYVEKRFQQKMTLPFGWLWTALRADQNNPALPAQGNMGII